MLEDLPLDLRQNLWFQQDGCPAHWARQAREAVSAFIRSLRLGVEAQRFCYDGREKPFFPEIVQRKHEQKRYTPEGAARILSDFHDVPEDCSDVDGGGLSDSARDESEEFVPGAESTSDSSDSDETIDDEGN